jgi:hypothetical protein
VMNTHFPIPETKTKTTKWKVESNKYFVISADEVYKQKLQNTKEKKQKGTRKREPKIEREHKNQMKQMKLKQEGHDGPESLTRNNCFSVLECQYILILNLSIEYV